MTTLAPLQAPSGRTRAIRLRPRSVAAIVIVSLAGVVAFGWPLLVDPGTAFAHSTDAPLVFALLMPLLLAVVMAEVSEGGLDVTAGRVVTHGSRWGRSSGFGTPDASWRSRPT